MPWLRKTRPTGPVPFGYKMAWIAVRCDRPAEVGEFLQLNSGCELSWTAGIEAAYGSQEQAVFLSPAIRGWTFVVGWSAAAIADPQPNKSFRNSLDRISQRFGEAQGFATHRVSEYHHWMLAKAGEIVRSFEYAGDQGEFLDDFGPLTEVERSIPFFHRPKDEWRPDEDDVMRVAAGWSLDPTALTPESGAAEPGLFGVIGLSGLHL